MVFRRRKPRTLTEWGRELVYPKGGFRRAIQYVMHRMRRLPDEPERVARGFAAGVFISFTPFFGFHLMGSLVLAWVMRGNFLAALLGTFVGNPLTTPIVAITSVGLGHWLLGMPGALDLREIGDAFANAGTQLWFNACALFTPDVMHWNRLREFFWEIYFPYMIGGLFPGIVVSGIFYYLTLPLVRAYQKLRAAKAEERVQKRRAHASSRDIGQD
ncbi:DUF2062 domain-containing protein [Falsirhodobacter sp. alg1]|uniref:DUF2062 domain-containing protein n=1 Tax=Falsirhodobacter sp. alg1 TaxID=1472418 RepID=UPI0005ED90C7|nr:DUF2062 domain-containing protein [Falsirhodobacter sp. alg1]